MAGPASLPPRSDSPPPAPGGPRGRRVLDGNNWKELADHFSSHPDDIVACATWCEACIRARGTRVLEALHLVQVKRFYAAGEIVKALEKLRIWHIGDYEARRFAASWASSLSE